MHLQGDYNIVINDFEKAKSLFADTDVKVFRKGQFILFVFAVRVCVQNDYQWNICFVPAGICISLNVCLW